MKRIPIQIRVPIVSDKQDCCPYEKPFGYIYMIVNKVTGHYYIGKHEFHEPYVDKSYFTSGKVINTMLYTGKYTKNDFEHIIIEWVDTNLEDLNKAEKYWICIFGSYVFPFHYNLTDGGDCGPVMYGEDNPNFGNHKPLSEEHKQKIKQNTPRLSGELHPMYGKHYVMKQETKQKISKATIGRKVLTETREKLSKSLTGRKLSEEHKNNIGKGTKASWGLMPEELKEKCLNNLKYKDQCGSKNVSARQIVQLDLNGNFIQKFDYMKQAEIKTSINRVSIGYCCRGSQNQAGGYKWMYLEDYINQGGKIDD